MKKYDLVLKKWLDYCNKEGIISATYDDFVNDEHKMPNIDWRREVRGLLVWINWGNGGKGDQKFNGGENRIVNGLKK